jgi:hypothetical protein
LSLKRETACWVLLISMKDGERLSVEQLRPKLAQIRPEAPPVFSPLRAAFDRLATEIDTCCKEERLAA